jgi:hypothetical protein
MLHFASLKNMQTNNLYELIMENTAKFRLILFASAPFRERFDSVKLKSKGK